MARGPSKYGFHELAAIGGSITLETTGPADTKRLSTAAREYANVRGWGLSVKKQRAGLIAITRVR